MKCTVKVFAGKDRGGEFTSLGELNFTNKGFEIFYKLDGDDCSLLSFGGTVVQKRCGAFNTEITFIAGEKTYCIFGEKDLRGTLQVYTYKMQINANECGARIFIDYDCGGERVNLTLAAEKIQEIK